MALSPVRPDTLSNPAASDFDSIPSSIGTSGTFVSVQQTPSGNVFDHDFDTLRSSLERRNILERGGFSNVATGARDPTSTGFDLNMKSHSELVADRQRSSVPQQPAAAAKDPLSLASSGPARMATALGAARAAILDIGHHLHPR